MSLRNKLVFYPTLMYHVTMARVSERKWYNRIDDTVILGALPFRGMTHLLKNEENIRGVVTLNEHWELKQFCNTNEQWMNHGVSQLHIPTVDFTASPTHENICKAVDFIQNYHNNKAGSVYVHCKAGKTRSSTVVACYLVKKNNWTPAEAVDFIRDKRPHIVLREKQLNSIQLYYDYCKNADLGSQEATIDKGP